MASVQPLSLEAPASGRAAAHVSHALATGPLRPCSYGAATWPNMWVCNYILSCAGGSQFAVATFVQIGP